MSVDRDSVRQRIRRRDPSAADYLRALAHDPCAYCDAPAEQLDHIRPTTRGGTDTWDNVIGACAACNASKNNRSLIGFLGRRINRVTERLRDVQDEAFGWNHLGVRA